MRVLLLSRYARSGASSRLRSFQYLPFLEQAGIKVTLSPLFDDFYVNGLSSGNFCMLAMIRSYFFRIKNLLQAEKFDLVWLEYEMLPWLPYWFESALLPVKVPLLVDYDDAIFHRYDQHRYRIVRKLLGQKIDAIMRRAEIVVAGNEYLADRAIMAGARCVEQLPTVVDKYRYTRIDKNPALSVTIGWIGQPSTAKYLVDLMPTLENIINTNAVRVIAIGPKPSQLEHFSVEVRPWREETEAAQIQQFDIGLMPLSDSVWERGKCGYKLIQYMACGIPVVASPVGVNCLIVENGVTGFLAKSESEWYEALITLCHDAPLRKRMGEAGRKLVEEKYDLQVAAPRLVDLLYAAVMR